MQANEAVRQPAQSNHTAPLRIGIAGAGAFAVFLAESLAPLPACRLVAVAGRTPAKRQAVLNAWRSRRPPTLMPTDPEPTMFDDARDLAVAEGVDAVLIATPPHLHAPLAEAAIAAGKHVLLEKPGALRAADLQRAADMARERQRALLVNLVMPHSPIVQAVQALMTAGALGPADMAVLHNQVHQVQDGHWFWDARQSGGILVEHGVHFFEVGRRWFGQPVAWHAGAAATDAAVAAQVSQADASVPARVWATVIHEGGGAQVPVHYYHGFVRPQEVPEDTAWQILCRYGRVNVYGWVPTRLEIEGTVPATLAPAVEQILDALPLEPSIEAMSGFHNAVQALTQAGAAGHPAPSPDSRVPVRRVVELRDRQGWYTALVQARFLDLLQAARQPGFRGLVTAEDAIADLALAEACTKACAIPLSP
ncbi:Gfo/Idh/MocA family protein [Alicyclobacillus macrosporangiidus]|uniref:Predicted dehydrogenase n=1 Tax=Alicyclobacillus macrosporangiidus TaxID=392015 RepID=A0A1I7GJB4_9BACL|nr:Gfo/Idh/MocA family oxidoreductase [Alicyclobacillus macrosporangiidus]SFU48528.1 Predicted dehydrogenase [Alicyclobacillus macrosporangiidus]